MQASKRLIWTLVCFLGIGVIAFLGGLFANPLRAWQIYLVNFLFWGGLAQGAVVFAATYHVVNARWGPPIRRLAEGMAVFLPVGFALFMPLYFGLALFLNQVQKLNPERGAWFDPRFIFVRGGLGLGSLTVLSLFFVYSSLRPETGLALERGLRPRRWLGLWLSEGWQGYVEESQRCQRGKDILAVGILLAYPITYTFMAFDLIMALDPFWYSSLFGAHFFISTIYLGLAGLAVVTSLSVWSLGVENITRGQLSDLGKLLLGFDLTYVAMLWSQYLVIWYGNLPEETDFVVLRLWQEPWKSLSWSSLVINSLIPFLIFLSRRAKQVPWIIFLVGILIAAGLWIERYVLVVPSLWHQTTAPFGWIEAGITGGFFGAIGLSYLFFLRNFSVLPLVQDQPSRAFGHPAENSPEEGLP